MKVNQTRTLFNDFFLSHTCSNIDLSNARLPNDSVIALDNSAYIDSIDASKSEVMVL